MESIKSKKFEEFNTIFDTYFPGTFDKEFKKQFEALKVLNNNSGITQAQSQLIGDTMPSTDNGKHHHKKLEKMKIEKLESINYRNKQKKTVKQDFSFECYIKNNNLILYLDNVNYDIVSISLSEFYNLSADKNILKITTEKHVLRYECFTLVHEILRKVRKLLQSNIKKFN